MNSYQVNCINKSNTYGFHEHITHIGNSDANWRLTKEDATDRIENKGETFFTVEQYTGKKMFIGVVRESGKAPYLRTHADGVYNDNLLAQGNCGANGGSCKRY